MRVPIVRFVAAVVMCCALQVKAGTGCDSEAGELGSLVLDVHAAIANPEAPEAMDAITRLGTDSRYYTMVRGWLSQKLAGDRSILEASGDNASPEIVARVEFLERAIRAIDLE